MSPARRSLLLGAVCLWLGRGFALGQATLDDLYYAQLEMINLLGQLKDYAFYADTYDWYFYNSYDANYYGSYAVNQAAMSNPWIVAFPEGYVPSVGITGGVMQVYGTIQSVNVGGVDVNNIVQVEGDWWKRDDTTDERDPDGEGAGEAFAQSIVGYGQSEITGLESERDQMLDDAEDVRIATEESVAQEAATDIQVALDTAKAPLEPLEEVGAIIQFLEGNGDMSWTLLQAGTFTFGKGNYEKSFPGEDVVVELGEGKFAEISSIVRAVFGAGWWCGGIGAWVTMIKLAFGERGGTTVDWSPWGAA